MLMLRKYVIHIVKVVLVINLRLSPFEIILSPQFNVERVAGMLSYFLLQLVGPQRKSLSPKDPGRYKFSLKHLLKQVGIDYISNLPC